MPDDTSSIGRQKKPVAQPVDRQNGRIHPLRGSIQAAGARSDGSGTHHMCLGRRPRTARQNKIAQHRQPGTVGIDLLLEPVRPSLVHLPQRIRLRFTGKCQLPAQIKQLLLQQYEIGQESLLPAVFQPSTSLFGNSQLVDGAIGLDTFIVFGQGSPIGQSREPLVPLPCIYSHSDILLIMGIIMDSSPLSFIS